MATNSFAMNEDSARKTVDKAMRMLHAFTSENTEYTISELSQVLGMHKSVVSRLASSLRDWGMLEKDELTHRIRIGAGAFRLGTLYARDNHLIRVAKGELETLVQHTGQSSHMTIQDGLRVLVVATADSPNALRVIMRLGDYRHLHATAAGKLFLAFGDNSLREQLLQGPPLPQITPNTLTRREDLNKELQKIKREKLAWNRGENTVGAGAVAAPVVDSSGHMIAAISVVYPLHVINAESRKRIAAFTMDAARNISDQLEITH
jgi:IclR family transcriptional regulator, KDG regulon repressor